jgi:adenosylmethionine-8-amino-7-oxononanoate aminotransferase
MLLAMVSHDLRQPLQIIMAAHDALEVRLIGEPVFQVNTYGGHPVAAAVALRNIEILEAERLADRSAEIGVYLLDGLRGLISLAVVGDVRGKGLLIGVELVKDRITKEQLDAAQLASVGDFCWDNGVIVGRAGGGRRSGTTITLCPPLMITRAECARIVDTLGRALKSLDIGIG